MGLILHKSFNNKAVRLICVTRDAGKHHGPQAMPPEVWTNRMSVANLRLVQTQEAFQMADTIERTDFPGMIETGDAPFCSIVQDDNYAYLAGIVAADFPDGRAARAAGVACCPISCGLQVI